ncbi:MAG: chemotaxis protein CheW [Clostridiales bacterium]|jgi:purine-binding chemotaxis protein CheW|nr:chemotaxis protein CheW [Clostridiales bacterium]
MEKNEITADNTSTTKNRFLSFVIGNEDFGLEIDVVKEIINTIDITPVPHTPGYIRGIMNMRGDIIPVIDVRTRFMMESKPYDDMTCVVVIEEKDYNIGLVVDSVNEVKFIEEENISPPPSAKLRNVNQFIRNLGRSDGRVMLLVDTQKFLHDDPQM